MAVQTIPISSSGSLTSLSMVAYPVGVDAVAVDTVTPTIGANDTSLYTGAFTDLPAADYRIVLLSNSVEMAQGRVTTLAATGTYLLDGDKSEFDVAVDEVSLLTATQASVDAIEVDTNELQADWKDTGRLDTIMDTVNSNVALIPTTAMRGTDSANTVVPMTAAQSATDHLTTQNAVGAVGTDVNTLLTRLPAAFFAGITSLAEWLGLMAGNQVANATAKTELQATGAGSGTYDEATDSLEALRVNQSASGNTLVITPVLVTVTSVGVNSPPLSQYTDEGKVQSLTFQDSDGVSVDMSSKLSTLEFVVSDDLGKILLTVLAAGMTNTGTGNEMINITIPVFFKDRASYRYSLRDNADNDFVWAANAYKVIFAPILP